jgi:NADPH2:quinone reductase
MGLEFAGVIVSASSSVYPTGSRVFGSAQGSFAEYLATPISTIRPIPNKWTFEEAAGLAATAPVSYGALIVRGKLRKGETVLVHAAAGGLGLMAVQIAKAIGVKVIATAGSEEKINKAREYGADETVLYTEDKWWEQVLNMTGGEGVDVVYDPVGMVDKSLKCLKHKGRVLVVGFSGTEGKIEKIAMNRILLKQASVIGYVGTERDYECAEAEDMQRYGESGRRYPKEPEEIWRGLMELIGKGLVRPAVYEQEYGGLESVARAMKDLAARKVWGKAIITLNRSSKSKL